MKIRDLVFLVIGGLLVISGMVLNSVLVTDADAQSGLLDMNFGNIACRTLIITDGDKVRGSFGLSTNDEAILTIYGDDGEKVAYLGENVADPNGEMMLRLKSKSKTDKREVSMNIDKNGGRLDCDNKMGENVVRLVVGSDGGGGLDVRDKYGYEK